MLNLIDIVKDGVTITIAPAQGGASVDMKKDGYSAGQLINLNHPIPEGHFSMGINMVYRRLVDVIKAAL